MTEGHKIDIVQLTIEDKNGRSFGPIKTKEHVRGVSQTLGGRRRTPDHQSPINAENDRTLSTAKMESDVQHIRNHQLIATADASAKSQTIVANVELSIARAKVEQIEEFRFASEHIRSLKEAESRYHNAKEYWIGTPETIGPISIVRKLFNN